MSYTPNIPRYILTRPQAVARGVVFVNIDGGTTKAWEDDPSAQRQRLVKEDSYEGRLEEDRSHKMHKAALALSEAVDKHLDASITLVCASKGEFEKRLIAEQGVTATEFEVRKANEQFKDATQNKEPDTQS